MARALSARGSRVLNFPKPSFSGVYYASLGKLFDSELRPAGIVNLAVAENRLAAPLVAQRLEAAGTGVCPESLAYNPYPGSDRLRAAVARVASRHVAGGALLDPGRVVLTCGAGSALWTLAGLLAEPGHGVMVPTPYYYAYDRDFTALLDCKLVKVDGCSGTDPIAPEALSAARDAAAAEGTECRLLVITNPSNPTGEVVSKERLRAAITWAEAHGIDVVMNELYACSVSPGGFNSVLALYRDDAGACSLPPHVHFIWGLSKDFAVNGLRCGCLYSGSPELTEASMKFAYFTQVAGTAQQQLAACLEDDAWVDGFLEESRLRVRRAMDATCEALASVGASYQPPDGALFVWADLRAWADAVGGETALFERLAHLPGGGVLVCPGSTFHAPEGFFRICVTAAPQEHLSVGLQRLVEGLGSKPLPSQ